MGPEKIPDFGSFQNDPDQYKWALIQVFQGFEKVGNEEVTLYTHIYHEHQRGEGTACSAATDERDGKKDHADCYQYVTQCAH